jgi:hypothetical protein
VNARPAPRLGSGWPGDPAFVRERARHAVVVEAALHQLLQRSEGLVAPARHWLANGAYPDGQLQHFLAHEWASPAMEYGFWLIEDRPTQPVAAAVRRQLMAVAMGSEIATRMGRAVLTAEPALPRAGGLLLPWWSAWIAAQIVQACPDTPHLLSAFHEAWASWITAEMRYRERHWGRLTPFDATDEPLLADRFALSRIGVALASTAIGREDELPVLTALVDQLNLGMNLLDDLRTLRVDLSRRHYSWPIMQTLVAARCPLQEPVIAATLLGAAVLTGAVSRLADEWQVRLTQTAHHASALDLPRFATAAHWLQDQFGAIAHTFSLSALKGTGSTPVDPDGRAQLPGHAFIVEARPPVALARQMARDYLLADETFRESWEVYRWGFLNQPVQTSRRYPVGLILENLAHAGLGRPDLVDALLDDFIASGFHYFDEASPLPPDSDSISLMFRLTALSRAPQHYRERLAIPLGWVRGNQQPSGEVRIWFHDGPAFDETRAYFSAILQLHCTAIQANLIGGLQAMGIAPDDPLLQGTLRWYAGAVAERGGASSWFYPHAYWLWAWAQWVRPLHTDAPASQHREAMPDRMVAERHQLIAQGGWLPLTAAWLVLSASPSVADPPALTRALQDRLLESQRPDGSWEAEPLYFGPSAGNGMTAHSSRLLTTSYCLRALAHLSQEAAADG